MLSTKYLELDSAYRNRNLYPEAAQFTVPVSQFGLKTQAQALDPITDAYPAIIFSPADFYVKNNPLTYTSYTFTATETNPVQTSTLLSTTSALVYVLTVSIAKTVTISGLAVPVVIPGNGYFNGAVLVSESNSTLPAILPADPGSYPGPSTFPNGLRRICDSQLLIKKSNGTNWDCTYKFTIESEFSGELVATGNNATRRFYIPNPTDFTDATSAYIFIPNSITAQNFYATPNYIIWNQTQGNYAKILSYDGITHIAKLSDISNLNWALTDVFIVRTSPPKLFNKLLAPTFTPGFNVPIYLPPISSDTVVNETLINSFIRLYFSL